MNLFTVRRVDYVSAQGYEPEMLALVEEEDQTGDFIVIQRAEQDDPDEVELGLSGPCLVRPGGETAYNAVESYDVSPDQITLRLTPDGAQALGLDQLVELRHHLPDAEIFRLRDLLATILGDESRSG
jgi:hypothetical protein